jgi:tetratricopeptide (TPR) repeat protein
MLVSVAFAWQPQSSEMQSLLRIQKSIQAGDLKSARSEIDAALLRSPRDPRLFNFLGVVEAQQQHTAAAETNFRKAIQIAPRFTEAYLNLGRLYQQQTDESSTLEKAIAVYQTVLSYDPAHIEAHYQAASLLHRQGNYAFSLKHLSRLPAEAQQRAPALALQCANNVALGRNAAADTAATQLLASKELTEADVITIFPVLVKYKADDLAMRLLDGLVRRGLASKATMLARMAQVKYGAGDLEGALGYLAHARDLEPDNAAIHFFFGVVCVELKLPPEARESLEKALRLDPGNAYYNYAFGAVLLNERKADEAIAHFQKYRGANPKDPRGSFAVGVAYFEAYQLDLAKKEFLSINNKPETRTGAELYLGKLALSENKTDEALAHFQEAIKAKPGALEAYAESALVRIRRAEYALAEKDLSRALALNPAHYLSNLRLLMLYQKTKDARSAAQARRVEELQKQGEERERFLLRSLDIRPY